MSCRIMNLMGGRSKAVGADIQTGERELRGKEIGVALHGVGLGLWFYVVATPSHRGSSGLCSHASHGFSKSQLDACALATSA